MQLNPSEISELIKSRIEKFDVRTEAHNEGTIVGITDGIVRIHGLADVMSYEMLEFPGNIFGLALNLERDSVGAVVLGDYKHLSEGDPVKCTGCLQCELACSYEHIGMFNPSRSFIKVFTFHHEGRFAPYTCTQCDEAWCQRACPVDAISVDFTTGAKIVSDTKCVGCKVCTIACPFGTVNYNADSGKVVKCDLCGGSPQCVAKCPKKALRLIPEQAMGESKRLNNVLSYAHMKEIEYMEKGEKKTIRYAEIGKEEL